MTLDKEASYAIASWERFDEIVTDDLLRAVTSAFVIVAAADGDLARAEADRFLQLLRTHEALFAPLNLDHAEPVFRDLAGAVFSDPPAGRKTALAIIAAVADNDTYCELVRSAAEIALTADARRLDAEQVMLNEICKTLGIVNRFELTDNR